MKIVCVLISVFLIFSCTKEKSILVTATNPSTGEPFANLNGVLIERNFNTSGQSNGVGVEVLHFQTDANGQAMITYNFNKKRYYEVYLSPPSNYCYASDGFKKVFSENDQNVEQVDYQFYPCTRIKFRVLNSNCFDNNDLLIFFRNHESGHEIYYPTNFAGCANYLTSSWAQVPMGTWYFSWEVTKNNVTTVHHDTIFLNEEDTLTYNLIY